MTNDEIISLAKEYFIREEIPFVEPGELGRTEGVKQEVIFLDPLVLDPKVAVVVPEDIRVCVNTETKEVTLIYQI